MERNDIALVRRWAEEIAKDEVAGLELKFAEDIKAVTHQIEKTVLRLRRQGEDIEKVKEKMSETDLVVSKDFALMKEELAKKPQKKKATKTVESAIKPDYKTR